ncbi:MAG TPA: hypothetical protein VJ283_20270 [Trebonia sp.]|jgi:hypothetical protein|nr:hypothetical protein [Trebonia sp.]
MAYIKVSSLHLASAARRRIDSDVLYLPAFGSFMHYDKSLSWPQSIEKPAQHIAFPLYLKDSFSDAIKLAALGAVQTSMQIASQNAPWVCRLLSAGSGSPN